MQGNQRLQRETRFIGRYGINIWLGIFRTKIIDPYSIEKTLSGQNLNLPQFNYGQQDGVPPHLDKRRRDY